VRCGRWCAFAGVLLLIAACSCGGCATPRSAEPVHPDVPASTTPQRGEPEQSAGSRHETPQSVERTLPDGAVSIELRHADACDVARTLNELDEASFWSARSQGCVLYMPLEALIEPAAIERAAETAAKRKSLFDDARWIEIAPAPPCEERQLESLREYLRGGSRLRPLFRLAPPPPSFRAWDARTLVVLEAGRDESYLPGVREFVERVDVAPPDE
jgi:hypothetical protein